jgi:prepilin-type N-terminal cleavage/methylation domain-containing protein
LLHSNAQATQSSAAGFTLVELLIVISVVVILFISFGTFFTNYLKLYFGYQQDGSNAAELSTQSLRITDVLRGATDLISESGNDLSAYAYFSPADAYVSTIHYYLNSTGTKIMADVTPMTANPPTGTLIASEKATYTIISSYYQPSGSSLFTYYDASGNVLVPPIADEHAIMEIQVNLSEPASHNQAGQQLAAVASLRNRKTNL